MTQTLAAPLAPFADALPVPRRLVAAEQNGRLSVPIRAGAHRFHRDLPESVIWGYDGTVPGPTIEAERGQPVTVRWRNELDGALPVVVTTAPVAADTSGVPVQCVPGLSGGVPDRNAAALAGHTVVHLHGGLTPASYDGWAENLFAPGQDAVFHYPMDQRAALLWYHDHVMGVTRFGVYAGLAGLWIIRDQRERQLGLPEGPPFEVPLLIQDRNFGLDDSGRLTGQLVHKTDPEVMEAFPPFTVVNGKVWPLLEVQPATYRFRILDGSNARTYRLVLLRDGEPELHRITQIGTDHGLLRTPARVPPDGLVLASAERADLLVDFSGLEPGSELTLVNTAAAPFDGAPFPAANARGAADPGLMLPYPHVMSFRVVPGPVTRRAIPGELATDYRPHSPDALARAPRRTIALVERELEGEPNMLTMRELVIADDDHTGPVVTVTDDEQTTRYRAAAAHFEDATTFFPVLDRYETSPSPPQSRSTATLTTSAATPSTTTNAASRTPSASTPTRSPKSPSASPPTAAATCTTATSSNTKTAT
jgi:FtsP/CotA-like multicopper oxidase with cupredoxin domain